MASAVLGDFRVSLIRDAVYWWDAGAMFGVVPRTMWSRQAQADEWNRVPMGFNCYLIETGAHTILVETGAGDKMDARARERMKLPPEQEPLPETIARHGFDPERIDIVINSHLHWDHCGGNTRLANGIARPNFARAVYYAARGEWEHAHERHLRDRVSYIDANYDPLVEAGRMQLLESDHEVAPGVWMRSAPGHNRDMMVVTAASGERTFCFFSDLVPTAAHLNPTWVAAFDLFPLTTIDTKIRWLNQAVEEQWVCGFGHDPETAFATVRRHPKIRFEAVPLT